MKRYAMYGLAAAALLGLTACNNSGQNSESTNVQSNQAEQSTESSVEESQETEVSNESEETKETEESKEPKESEETKETEAEKPNISYDDSIVGLAVSENGTYTDQFGYEDEYSYEIPKLLLDTPGAKKFNAKIEDEFGNYVKQEKEAMRNQDSLVVYNISYKTYWKDNILSIVVKGDTCYEIGLYGLYAFDFDNDKALNDEDLLKLAGVSKTEFVETARKQAISIFDTNQNLFGNDEEEALSMYYSDVIGLRRATLNQFVNMFDDKEGPSNNLYFNEEGKLCVLTRIGVPAGAGFYYKMMSLDFEKTEPVSKKITEGFITAELKKGKVYVSFEETEDAKTYLEGGMLEEGAKGIRYGQSYEVNGLYSVYEDIYLGNIKQFPYLILLTKDKTIQFANVVSSTARGYTSGGIPIADLQDIQKIEAGFVDGEETIIAVNGNGEKYDLAKYIKLAEYSMSNMYKGDFTWAALNVPHELENGGEYISSYDLQFGENGLMMFYEINPDAEYYMNMEGTYQYVGCNDYGDVYAYTLMSTGKEKAYYEGTFAIDIDSDMYEGIRVRIMTDNNPFDLNVDDELILTQSMG